MAGMLVLNSGCSAQPLEPEGPHIDATILWLQAESLMRNGHVTEVYQSQVKDRDVFLHLTNGKLVMTREPRRGALVEFLSECDCGVPVVLN